MKKKLFFKLFIFAVIGALVTVTSCKDYDDDISRLDTDLAAAQSSLQAAVTELNTLKTQIATKADQSAVSQAVATAKTEAINTALANATELLNTLKGGYTGTLKDLNDDIVDLAALIEVLDGDISALQERLDQAELLIALNTVAIALQQDVLDQYLLNVDSEDNVVVAIEDIKIQLAALGALVEINTEDIEAIMEAIEAIDAQLNVLDFNVNSMITDITFDYAYDDVWARYRYLEYSTTTEVVDFVFAPSMKNAITFVEGQRLASQAQKIMVKVSPANADLSKMLDKISLIRSDANTEINGFLKAVKAERATPLLVGSGWRSTLPTATGLWEVSFELSQTADLEDLVELTQAEEEEEEGGFYLYAMAIENTVDAADDAENRFIVSDFVINIETSEDFDRASDLEFTVNDVDVEDINNRAADGSLSLSEDGITYVEKVWDGYAQPTVTSTNTTEGDDRSLEVVYPAVQGQPMTIKLTGDYAESIRAMYVTLDYQQNAIESAPSEWNAWNSYSYSGLKTVVEGTETEIVINNASAINDVIGFRVFAVNVDGTLVDPDGKAFYVSLGVQGEDWGTVNTVITPESVSMDAESAQVAKTLSELTGAASFVWTTDEDEDEHAPAFNAYFVDADGDAIFNTATGLATASFEDVAKIYTVPTATSWLEYEDNKVYNGTLTVKNGTGHVLATLKVTFKKTLPTTSPAGFSVKTNQLGTDGIYRSYLIPMQGTTVNWTAPLATNGSMPLSQVFNFTGDALAAVANFDVIFADAAKSGSNLVDLKVNPANATLIVAKEFIDNTTQHETTVVYNYGQISTELDGDDYVIEIESFPTIFSNIYNNTYSWSWDEDFETEIEYGTTTTINASNILGKSTRDNIYNAPLSAPYGAADAQPSLSLTGLGTAVGGAKLYSNGTTIEEYFNAVLNPATGIITLTEASGSSNPTANVASTLVITAFDMYGHEVTIELPMTVLTRN